MNARGGSEEAVTARTRIDWIKFSACGEFLSGRKLSSTIQARIYQSCVKLILLCESETRCIRKDEMAILRRIERAIIGAMCRVKLIEKKG